MNKIVRGICVAFGVALFGASYYLYNNFFYKRAFHSSTKSVNFEYKCVTPGICVATIN